MNKILVCWLLALFAGWSGLAQARAQRVDAVEVELLADRAAVVPGQPLTLGLRIRHDPHWHTYWRNPGDSGLPTQLDLKLPEGWQAGALGWPAPQRLPVGPLMNFGYDGEILLPLPVTVPAQLTARQVRIEAQAQWLVCKDVCIPGEAQLVLELPVAAAGAAAGPSPRASLFEAMTARLPSRTLAGQAAVSGGALSVAFDGATVGSAEFYPYKDALIENASAQRLYRVAGDPPRARLELALAQKVDSAALRAGGFFEAPAGVLIVDGVPYELVAKPVASLAVGQLVAQVAGAPASGAATRDSGGLQLPRGLEGSARAGADVSGSPSVMPAAGDTGNAMSLGLAMLFALLGGLVLNLMPCVFPVIGLKVLAFADCSRDDPRSGRFNAVCFAAGVMVSFWLLAGLLIGLRQAGDAVGWGFQLQSPAFVSAMALLFVAIGLNLSGLFEIGLAATRLERSARPGGQRPLMAFASGVLAVLVASPCTAPFMGSALGFTLGQPTGQALAVFTALGLGMALPYLVLGWFPALLRRLPRPGRWMQTLRQALAFPMYATAAWLAWVLGMQSGIDAVFGLSLAMVLLGLAAWCYGRFVQGAPHAVGVLCTLAALLAAGWCAWPADAPLAPPAAAVHGDWQPWSEAAVAQGLTEGRTVFVDFTAAWCVSCQVNKKVVLEREPVAGEMASRKVLKLRADWTRRDPVIGEALARHGRNGVPLYLVYQPGRTEPLMLPELLTTALVLRGLTATPASALLDGSSSSRVVVNDTRK